jgi:tetratricopeptide (TPR) repeat protein
MACAAPLGRFDEARAAAVRARVLAEDLGQIWRKADATWIAADIEFAAGNLEEAERWYRVSYEAYERMGEKSNLSGLACFLGKVLFEEGRHGEALDLSRQSEQIAGSEDRTSQMLWRCLRARVMAANGEFAEAERLARTAVEIARGSEDVEMLGEAIVDLAEVLRAAGSSVDARLIAEALDLFERKGNVVSAAKTRALLQERSATKV